MGVRLVFRPSILALNLAFNSISETLQHLQLSYTYNTIFQVSTQTKRYLLMSIPISLLSYEIANLCFTLKVASGANFDFTKITGTSLLFQANFPDCSFDNYIVRELN